MSTKIPSIAVADAIGEEVAEGLYSAEQVECVLDTLEDSGVPASFTIKTRAGKDGVVGGPNNTDGRGIDHVFASYGGAIFGAYHTCGVEFPEE